MKPNHIPLLLALPLLLSLASCGGETASAPDMPMEVTVEGSTIVLGQTTMQDLLELGYEAELETTPPSAQDGDKYIPFSYRLDRGEGDEMLVTVCTPWNGGTDISKEITRSATEGIVKSVTLSTEGTENVTAVYNGIDIQELTFDYAVSEWGAQEKEGTVKPTYELEAKRGHLQLKAKMRSDTDFYSISVQLSMEELEGMQEA